MEGLNKKVRIGSARHAGWYGGKRAYDVFCRIQISDDGRLSITGVEGPKPNGIAAGSCGQIDMHEWNIDTYAPGWSRELEVEFRRVWKAWHLNDMRAECEHQRALGWTYATHPSAECPECGYRLGTSWLREELPESVIEFLKALPPTDTQPAWV